MLDLSSLEKACDVFKLSLELYDKSGLAPETDERVLLRDGVIQRFEFTYELSWKMIKRYLDVYGLEKADGLNNKDLFRVGREQGLIDAPERWFHYLKMRNQTSHVYDKEKAAEVFAAAREFLPGVEVRVFGSRVNGVSKDWSDVDLAMVGEARMDPKALTRLKGAFEDSDLPYRVDLLDWHNISPEFRELIQARYEIIQPAAK